MNKVLVKFKSPIGTEIQREIRTSGSAKKAANALASQFPLWVLVGYAVNGKNIDLL